MSLFSSFVSRLTPSRIVCALLPLQIAYGIFILVYLSANGHLPAPFFFDYYDTFMDFFNTNYWAFQEGRYQEWGAIYPIFVFALAKLFTAPACVQTPFLLRSCDLGAMSYLVLGYAIAVALCASLVVRHMKDARSGRVWASWFIVIGLNIAGLFALERGNYVIMAFMFLSLAAFYEGDWKSALFLALAINIKQYLAVLWLVPFLKGRYDLVLLGIIFAIIPNILGLMLVPDFHYAQLLKNMLQFSSTSDFAPAEKIWMSTSYAAWVRVAENVRALRLLDGGQLVFLQTALAAGLWLTRGLFVIALGLVATRPAGMSSGYIALVCLVGLMASVDSLGGYALLFLLPYIGDFFARPYGKLMSGLCVLVYLPMGVGVGPAVDLNAGSKVSFLTKQNIFIIPEISLGAYLRPVLVMALLAVIVLDLVAERRKYKCAALPDGVSLGEA